MKLPKMVAYVQYGAIVLGHGLDPSDYIQEFARRPDTVVFHVDWGFRVCRKVA